MNNIIIPILNFVKIMGKLISLKENPYSQSWIYRTNKNTKSFKVSFSGYSSFNTMFFASDESCIFERCSLKNDLKVLREIPAYNTKRRKDKKASILKWKMPNITQI
jgi:hypothetical protein